MPKLLTTELGNMVLFEGESRAAWTRSGDDWRFDGIWPNVRERRELHRRIADGSSLLVILPLSDSPIVALGSELGVDEDTVEIQVPPLDWLSMTARRQGLNYRAFVAGQLSRIPPPLRSGVMVNPGTGAVRFAVQTSRNTKTTDRAFVELADHLFTQPHRRHWANLFRGHAPSSATQLAQP
jgi:hypothetical protein